MRRQKDLIENILARRERGGSIELFMIAQLKLIFLRSSLKTVGNDEELLKYFPVALIARLESFFRGAIAILLNGDQTRLSRILDSSFGRDHKFDLSVLGAVGNSAITVGELVAHLVPISKLEHVEGFMSLILGRPFFDQLRTAHDRGDVEIRKLPPSPIIGDYQGTLARLARAFDYRHLIAHGTSDTLKLTQEEVAEMLAAGIQFLEASTSVVLDTLHPNAPLTQADMNEHADRSFHEVDKALASKVAEVSAALDDRRRGVLERAQEAWLNFREAHGSFADLYAEGGSMGPMLSSIELSNITSERIEQLQRSKFHLAPDLDRE